LDVEFHESGRSDDPIDTEADSVDRAGQDTSESPTTIDVEGRVTSSRLIGTGAHEPGWQNVSDAVSAMKPSSKPKQSREASASVSRSPVDYDDNDTVDEADLDEDEDDINSVDALYPDRATPVLNVVLKADTVGALHSLVGFCERAGRSSKFAMQVHVVRSGVGPVNNSDVRVASAAGEC